MGHGVAHEVHQNGPKWSPMHDRANCFEFALSDIYDLFLDYMIISKGIGVCSSHRGVMGSHMRCTNMHQNGSKWTKMDQNGPKWTKLVQNGHHSMTEQINQI